MIKRQFFGVFVEQALARNLCKFAEINYILKVTRNNMPSPQGIKFKLLYYAHRIINFSHFLNHLITREKKETQSTNEERRKLKNVRVDGEN